MTIITKNIANIPPDAEPTLFWDNPTTSVCTSRLCSSYKLLNRKKIFLFGLPYCLAADFK